MPGRRAKRERAREPEESAQGEGPRDRDATEGETAAKVEHLGGRVTVLPTGVGYPPATWADVAVEAARASRAAAEAASAIAATGHPEGVELVSQEETERRIARFYEGEVVHADPGLRRAEASQREVEWLRTRIRHGESAAQVALDALNLSGLQRREDGLDAIRGFLDVERPEWHIEHTPVALPAGWPYPLSGPFDVPHPPTRPEVVEGDGQAPRLRRGDVLRVSLEGSPVFFAEVTWVEWRNEPTWEGVEVGLHHLPEVAEPQGHGRGYVTVTQPPIDSLEHFQKMAKGQQKRAQRLSEALAHMTGLHTRGKRAAVKMQKRISTLQTALEEERMRADRAQGACERMSREGAADVERLASAAIDAEREQKDRVTRFLREAITQAIGQTEAAVEGHGRPSRAIETLQQALRDAYDPDEIPF